LGGGEGNLFLSFVVDMNSLPSDLPIASASIYFSYIIKEVYLDIEKIFLLNGQMTYI